MYGYNTIQCLNREYQLRTSLRKRGTGYHNKDIPKTSLIKTYFFCHPHPIYFRNVLHCFNKNSVFKKNYFCSSPKNYGVSSWGGRWGLDGNGHGKGGQKFPFYRGHP